MEIEIVYKCYGLPARAIDVAFRVHECPRVLLNVHAYFKRAIERLHLFNKV